jgi:heme exporter protein C
MAARVDKIANPVPFIIAAGIVAIGFVVIPLMVFKAPLPAGMFFSQKIFYYHVPAAWTMFLAIICCGVASALYLAKRSDHWDQAAQASAAIAVLFGAIVLTTGPIWAKAHWSKYWIWEARLVSSLLIWMIAVAYTLVRRYGGPGMERLAAGIGIFGAVNVPLVYWSTQLWRTQHPQNTVVPSLDNRMRPAFYLSLIVFIIFFTLIYGVRRRLGRTSARLAALELAAEDLED